MRRRRVLGGVVGLLAVLVVVVALGFFPQEPLRRMAERRLREALGPQAHIGHLQVVPGRLEAELRDLLIETPAYRIEIPRLKATLAPGLLLGRALAFRSLQADGGRVFWHPRPRPEALEPSPDARPILVSDLRLSELLVVYRPPDLAGEATFEHVQARGSLGSGTLALLASGGVWQGTRRLPLGPLTARLEVAPDLDLKIQSLDAGTSASRLRLSGMVDGGHPTRVDLLVNARVDLADAVALGLDPSLAGVVALTAQVSGALDRLRATGSLESEVLRASGFSFERVRAQVESDEGGRLSTQATGSFLGGQVQGQAKLDGTALQLTATGQGLQTARLPREAGAAAWAATLSGRLSAHGDVNGTLETSADLQARTAAAGFDSTARATVSGSVRPGTRTSNLSWRGELESAAAGPAASSAASLRGVRLTGAGTAHGAFPPVLEGQLGGHLQVLSGSETLELPVRGQVLMHGDVLRASAHSESRAGRVDGVLEASSARVERLELQARDLDLAALPGGARGGASLELALHGPLERLSGSGQARATALHWSGLELGEAQADLTLRGGRGALTLDVPELHARATAEGQLGRASVVHATATLTDTPLERLASVAARLPRDGVVTASLAADIDLRRPRAEVRARLTEAVVTSRALAGRARGELVLSVGPRPSGQGLITLEDLRWSDRERLLAVVPAAEVRLAGERLVVPDLRAQVGGGELRLSGEAPIGALWGREEAQAPPAELRGAWERVGLGPLMSALGRSASTVEATLSGQLQVRGPLHEPQRLNGSLTLVGSGVSVDDLVLTVTPLSVELRQGQLRASGLSVESQGARLDVSAQADLVRRTLSGSGQGRLDLRSLTPLLDSIYLRGLAEVDLRVDGTFDAPRPMGALLLREATVRVPDLAQPLTHLNGRVGFDGARLRLEDVRGRLGGGTLDLTGGARLERGTLVDVELGLQGRDLNLRHHSGLRTRARADLTLRGAPGALLLAGSVVAERGLYDSDVFLEDAVLAPELPPSAEDAGAVLASIGLALDVSTESPVQVRNNLAELAAGGRLRILGDALRPAPFGRLEVRPGGKLFLQTRELTVVSGGLIYSGTLVPDVSLQAEGQVSQAGGESVDVTVTADGSLLAPSLGLSSDPFYSEREIASLIATGRRDVGLDSGAWVAGEQTAALLAGRLTRNLSRSFLDLGLDEVRIQPELLAREADPGARFTFGKNLTPRLKLVYSIGLNDAEGRIFEAQYRLRRGREATAALLQDENGVYSYGVGQRLRWGAPARARRARAQQREPLREVRFVAPEGVAVEPLRQKVKAEAGERASDWDLQDDAERLQQQLKGEGHLDALVSVTRTEGAAVFDIEPGPVYTLEVRGMPEAPDLSGDVRSARFAEEALERGGERLLESAHRRGFPKASVRPSIAERPGGALLLFEVELGAPLAVAEVAFPGAQALSQKELLAAAGGAPGLMSEPEAARKRLLAEYRRAHHLLAKVEMPRLEPRDGSGPVRIVTAVDEGPAALLASVRFEGASVPAETLQQIAQLTVGAPYDEGQVGPAVQRLRDDYLKRGYGHVRVTPQLVPAQPDLEVVFQVAEGPARTVGEVRVQGLQRTRESLVRGQVQLKAGEPLDPRKLVALEKRLLDLGMFSRVSATASENEPADVLVEVEEQGPYSVTYNVRWNDEDHATGLADVEAGNLFGRGLVVGARYQAGRDLRNARLSLHVPSLGKTGDLTASLFHRRDDSALLDEAGRPLPPEQQERLIERGFELQQTMHLRGNWDFLYGYRFRRVTRERPSLTVDVGGVELSALRERRNNPLDARSGSFTSLSLHLAPKLAGSDVAFVRVFAQAFLNHELSRSWSWSHAYRLGFANGLNESRLREIDFGRSSEFFRAGGGSSIRGYATDSVGPPRPGSRFSAGGEALLVLNQELRYRHPSGFGAVVFYDAGNAFLTPRELGFNLRHAVGTGVRYVSPIGLLRVDVGFPLNRRPADKAYRVFFSLGQAF